MKKVHGYTVSHSYINIPTTCDFCKNKFSAIHMHISSDTEKYANDYYMDECVSIRKICHKHGPRRINKNICPECTEKLLELLDKHFPRLNLEDEL